MNEMSAVRELLQAWEASLNPRHPESATPPGRVLGYGEISTVLAIEHPTLADYALKRMPMFQDEEEVHDYLALHETYVNRLREIGIHVPETRLITVPRPRGGYAVYILQKRLPVESIGNRLLHRLPLDEALRLVHRVLEETRKVYRFNAAHRGQLELGFDAQISNWAVRNMPANATTLPEEIHLAYFDTSTPLVQQDGRERLNPELFLRSAPSFLIWIVKLLFLEDVMTRYYNFRKVILDLIANFYKEKRAEWIPRVVEAVNTWVHNWPEWSGKPYTEKEIRDYYREDAFIWRFYLAARKIDRRLHEWLGKEYPYILPDKIER